MPTGNGLKHQCNSPVQQCQLLLVKHANVGLTWTAMHLQFDIEFAKCSDRTFSEE